MAEVWEGDEIIEKEAGKGKQQESLATVEENKEGS